MIIPRYTFNVRSVSPVTPITKAEAGNSMNSQIIPELNHPCPIQRQPGKKSSYHPCKLGKRSVWSNEIKVGLWLKSPPLVGTVAAGKLMTMDSTKER
jgi:hypothetical protein